MYWSLILGAFIAHLPGSIFENVVEKNLISIIIITITIDQINTLWFDLIGSGEKSKPFQ